MVERDKFWIDTVIYISKITDIPFSDLKWMDIYEFMMCMLNYEEEITRRTDKGKK